MRCSGAVHKIWGKSKVLNSYSTSSIIHLLKKHKKGWSAWEGLMMHQSLSHHTGDSKTAQISVLLGQILFVDVGQFDDTQEKHCQQLMMLLPPRSSSWIIPLQKLPVPALPDSVLPLIVLP